MAWNKQRMFKKPTSDHDGRGVGLRPRGKPGHEEGVQVAVDDGVVGEPVVLCQGEHHVRVPVVAEEWLRKRINDGLIPLLMNKGTRIQGVPSARRPCLSSFWSCHFLCLPDWRFCLGTWEYSRIGCATRQDGETSVQVNDGWLDMDPKSNPRPHLVQSLSTFCPITESIQSLSKPSPKSPISKEHGQTLDFKIQGLSRYCQDKLLKWTFSFRTNSGHRLHF